MGLLLEGSPPPSGPALQGRKGEGPSDSFQFAFLSDTHMGWGVFQPIIKELGMDGYAFAVNGGDIIKDNREDRYRFFFRELAEVRGKLPLYFVTGNHDVFDENDKYSLENFRRYCGLDSYWFPWGNAAFVVLDDAQLTIPEDQFRWLESTLPKLRGTFPHIFVFMHVPALDPQEGNHYWLPQDVSERFLRLMEKFGVDYVFSGHLHCYFRTVINGVTYIGAPSGGGTPRCADPSYGYIQVAVHGQKIKASLIEVEDNLWLQAIGEVKYQWRVRTPFLLPVLTVVLGQSFLYFLVI
jgi:predicted phosphodiesterase